MTVPLPIPDDPRLPAMIQEWPLKYAGIYVYPRSVWLKDAETILRGHYPRASSNELTLTARNLAPFPLALPGQP